MPDSTKKLLGMSPDELAEVAAAAGLRPFAARQMTSWLYQKRATSLEQMTDLPKRARAWLNDNGYFVGTQYRRYGQIPFRWCRRTRYRGRVYSRQGPRNAVRIVAGGVQDGMPVLYDRAGRLSGES